MQAPEVIAMEIRRIVDRSVAEEIRGSRRIQRSFENAQHHIRRAEMRRVAGAGPLPPVNLAARRRPLANHQGVARAVHDGGHVHCGVHIQDAVLAAGLSELVSPRDAHVGCQCHLVGAVADLDSAAGVGRANKRVAHDAVRIRAVRIRLPPRPGVQVHRLVQAVHLDVRGDPHRPTPERSFGRVPVRIQPAGRRLAVVDGAIGCRHDLVSGWKTAVGIVKVVHPDPLLLQVVHTLRPPRRLAGRLDGGQQQRNQDADDRDHDQQLDQRETVMWRRSHVDLANKDAGGDKYPAKDSSRGDIRTRNLDFRRSDKSNRTLLEHLGNSNTSEPQRRNAARRTSPGWPTGSRR